MKEFDLIAKYFAPLAKNASSLSLTDDVALMQPPEAKQLILTTDTIAEGIHYLPDTAPVDIARKLCAVNLSDIAAKGGVPLGALLNFGPLKDCGENWVKAFSAGLAEMMQAYDFTLFGGDTVAMTKQASFSLTLIAAIDAAKMPRRDSAAIGDDIYVSGQIGRGAIGLEDAKAGRDTDCAAHYLRPTPRLELGQKISHLIHASTDVSDGLIGDVTHILSASDCGAEIRLCVIPLADMSPERVDMQLIGGDDYEIAFTAPPSKFDEIIQVARELDISVTRIGIVTAGNSLTLLDGKGNQYTPSAKGYAKGWQHF